MDKYDRIMLDCEFIADLTNKVSRHHHASIPRGLFTIAHSNIHIHSLWIRTCFPMIASNDLGMMLIFTRMLTA